MAEAILFQFYKVRLKLHHACHLFRGLGISILQSSIKTVGVPVGFIPCSPFQFYKVRLKPCRTRRSASRCICISILQSSIKTSTRDSATASTRSISILQSSIKTIQDFPGFRPENLHFNSTKFD